MSSALVSGFCTTDSVPPIVYQMYDLQIFSPILSPVFFFFNLDFIFLEQFQVDSKTEGKVQRFSIYFLPPHGTVSLIISIPHESGTLVTMDKSTLILHHHHVKIIAFSAIHCSPCTFYGFRQVYNNTYLPLWYHTKHFHCPKTSMCSTYSSHPPHNLWQPLIFLLSPQFCLFQNVIELESCSMQPFQIDFKFPACLS